MIAFLVLVLSTLILVGSANATGWNDYHLDIAPGFSVWRMNSFEVCLGTPDGGLLCPNDYPDQVGPLVEYAVTDEAIFTRRYGVQPHLKNPAMLTGDPDKEFFFRIGRADLNKISPLTSDAWEEQGLPDLMSLKWDYPRNPNFWAPLLGTLFVLGFMLVYYGWPFLLFASIGFACWAYRKKKRSTDQKIQ